MHPCPSIQARASLRPQTVLRPSPTPPHPTHSPSSASPPPHPTRPHPTPPRFLLGRAHRTSSCKSERPGGDQVPSSRGRLTLLAWRRAGAPSASDRLVLSDDGLARSAFRSAGFFIRVFFRDTADGESSTGASVCGVVPITYSPQVVTGRRRRRQGARDHQRRSPGLDVRLAMVVLVHPPPLGRSGQDLFHHLENAVSARCRACREAQACRLLEYVSAWFLVACIADVPAALLLQRR